MAPAPAPAGALALALREGLASLAALTPSLVNVLGSDQWSEDVVPTVAFNLRQVRKGNVTMKVWDVAGQPKFRSMWDRYCRGADAIV